MRSVRILLGWNRFQERYDVLESTNFKYASSFSSSRTPIPLFFAVFASGLVSLLWVFFSIHATTPVKSETPPLGRWSFMERVVSGGNGLLDLMKSPSIEKLLVKPLCIRPLKPNSASHLAIERRFSRLLAIFKNNMLKTVVAIKLNTSIRIYWWRKLSFSWMVL